MDKSAKEIWEIVKGVLQIQINKANYETWVMDTVGISFEEGKFVVGSPNAFAKEWLEQRLSPLVRKTLIEVMKTLVNPLSTPEDVQVQFQVISRNTTNAANAKPDDLFAVSGPRFNPNQTFYTFITGEENRFARAAAMDVAENPGRVDYNPLFLLSRSGLGKTHLLNAIGHRATEKHLSVVFVTAEGFTNEFVTAIRNHGTEGFKTRFRGPTILIVDDFHFFGNGKKEKTLEVFCCCFDELYGNGRQIVLAGESMPNLPERLISRICGGLIVDIKPPSLETRLAILQAKVRQRTDIDPKILALIAQETDGKDVRVIQGILNGLFARSRWLSLTPSLEMAREILNDGAFPFPSASGSTDEATANHIIEAVASNFGVTPANLRGPKRDKMTALARQIAIYLLRENTSFPLQQIGKLLGGRNHSTVLHAYSRISKDTSLKERLGTIQQKLHK